PLRLLQEIRWIAVFVLGLFLAVILATYDRGDPGWSHSVEHADVVNGGGRVGAWFADLLLYQFGSSAWLLVALLVIAAWRGLRSERARQPDAEPPRLEWERWLGFGLFFLGCSMLEASRLHSISFELPLAPGGLVGGLMAEGLVEALGVVGSTLAMLLLVGSGFSLWTGWSWLLICERIGQALETSALRLVDAIGALRDRREGERAAT